MEKINSLITFIKNKYYEIRFIQPFKLRNKNRDIKPDSTICIFGFMRSGSTWFSDLLGSIPGSCIFDEPLLTNSIESLDHLPDYRISKVKELKKLGFYYFQPIPPNENWDEALAFFGHLLKGQTGSYFLYGRNKFSNLKYADNFVFQFNHGNLLSHWLKRNFDITSIYLIRNPYSVIASILSREPIKKISIDTKNTLPIFKFDKVFKKYDYILKSIRSKEEYYAFTWALNVIEGPLKMGTSNSLVVFYEDLVTNFRDEIDRIFSFLNKPIPDRIYDLQLKPSETTNKSSLTLSKMDQLQSWKEILTPSERKNINRILSEFNITFYDENPYPDKSEFHKVLQHNRQQFPT